MKNVKKSQKLIFPKISKTEFFREIEKRKFEDVEMIKNSEKFIKKYGPIISSFKKNEAVIISLSGGIDSVVMWAILMDQFQLNVYPMVMKQKLFDHQVMTVRYFSRLFKKKYPSFFHQPLIVNESSLGSLLPASISSKYYSAEALLDNFSSVTSEVVSPTSGHPFIVAYYSYFYSNYLLSKQVVANKIIFGITASDSLTVSAQSLTNLRLISQQLTFLKKSVVECFSFYFEPGLGHFYHKSDIINFGYKLRLPVELTNSCLKSLWHCGECSSCKHRRYGFKQVGIEDKTWYQSKK